MIAANFNPLYNISYGGFMVPRPREIYFDYDLNYFMVTGVETREDGFYTHYVDSKYKTYVCKSEAFIDKFTRLNNDSRTRTNGMEHPFSKSHIFFKYE